MGWKANSIGIVVSNAKVSNTRPRVLFVICWKEAPGQTWCAPCSPKQSSGAKLDCKRTLFAGFTCFRSSFVQLPLLLRTNASICIFFTTASKRLNMRRNIHFGRVLNPISINFLKMHLLQSKWTPTFTDYTTTALKQKNAKKTKRASTCQHVMRPDLVYASTWAFVIVTGTTMHSCTISLDIHSRRSAIISDLNKNGNKLINFRFAQHFAAYTQFASVWARTIPMQLRNKIREAATWVVP